ncbi:succinate dehydrogenase assembly factor 2, mitochondrial [Drosophila sulfurigaster albostrigata]|uniref:succinate dehydrogenase assembly factor 2, mitochondrial n=1 Tax=Drosophila sulfurigaster albostrigata TaxID=89887 RepID=UPI002D21C89B|nr:succinate dehydrogenase assembly factor 2, mitochondrial [Drosophila sulfurigaster albostrigata]
MLPQLLLCRNLARSVLRTWSRGASNSETTQDDVIVDFDDPDHLPLPEYPKRPNEPLNKRKQRLLYQSRKRGMLENDLLLSTFADKYLKDFDEAQTEVYDDLINGVSNDWDIYYWATGVKPTPQQYNTEIMKLLKEHVRNAEKVTRFRQPELTYYL